MGFGSGLGEAGTHLFRVYNMLETRRSFNGSILIRHWKIDSVKLYRKKYTIKVYRLHLEYPNEAHSISFSLP